MKRILLKIINFIIFLSIGIGLLYVSFKNVPMDSLIENLKKVKYFWVFLSLLAGFIAYVSRAYRWKLLIKPLGYSPSLLRAYNALMLGYLANFALPRLGEVTRCGVLAKTEKAPMDALIGTVIIERTIDLIVLVFVLIVTLLIKINYFGKFIAENIFGPISRKFLNSVSSSYIFWILVISIIVVINILLRKYRRKLIRIAFFRKMSRIMKGIATGIKTVAKMKNRKEFVIHTIIIWVAYFFMVYLLVFAYDATAQLKPVDGLFLLVIGSIGMSIPVQGGIGAFHWITSLGLTLYGITETDGMVYAVIAHESQSVLAILLGIAAFLMTFIFKKKKRIIPKTNGQTI